MVHSLNLKVTTLMAVGSYSHHPLFLPYIISIIHPPTPMPFRARWTSPTGAMVDFEPPAESGDRSWLGCPSGSVPRGCSYGQGGHPGDVQFSEPP